MMQEQYTVTIHADIERDDQILARLTARQLAILVPAAAAVWLVYLTTDTLLPAPLLAVVAAVVLGAAAALALVQRDGVGLDRLLVYAAAQAVRPRCLVPAPEGVPVPPGFAATGKASRGSWVVPAPLTLPVRAIRPDGVLDLGADGVAVLVACSTVSFALRTPGEQAGLVGGFAAWLNSLSGPAQILVHAQPLNLHPIIDALRDRAAGLPHPALEDAALDHAAFLAGLAETRELLARQVLVVLREPYGPTTASTGASGAAGRDKGDVDGAARRVLRRADQTTRALAAAGINARVLDTEHAATLLAQAADPTAPPLQDGAAAPDQTITGHPLLTVPAGDRHGRTASKETGR